MEENLRSKWGQPLVYAILILFGIFLGVFLKGNLSITALGIQHTSPIQEIVEIVKSKYVDSIPLDSLEQEMAADFLAKLDPHSIYIAPKSVNDVNEQLHANYRGIGIEFQQFRDSIFVSHVIQSGPAYLAGIKAGDILLKLNDSVQLSGNHLTSEAIRMKIKGPAETNLKLTVLRAGKVIAMFIKRADVPSSPIDAAYMINDSIGYIKIDRFADRTYEAFMQELDKMVQNNIRSLVLDLRGNGGGLLSEAVAIADEFISGNKLIVYTEGLHAPKTNYYTKREGLYEKGNLTVLIDESSASASEILAGALQDWSRAIIVGRTSFGKGLVQQQFNLSNGGALRLTIAKYYTPKGRNIQRSYSKGKLAYEHDFINRIEKDANGKTAYDGGGIYPDHWVKSKSLFVDSNFQTLVQSGLLNDFSLHWFVQNNQKINSFTSISSFVQWQEQNNLWEPLYQFADIKQQKLLVALVKEKLFIQNMLIANIARVKWFKQGYYETLNRLDPQFNEMLLFKK